MTPSSFFVTHQIIRRADESDGARFSTVCPKCGKWFALEYLLSKYDKTIGTVYHFRCKRCQYVAKFASARLVTDVPNGTARKLR
jgi:phage terminase large subunit GpA-like protein